MQKFIWDLDETLLSADFRKEDDFFKEVDSLIKKDDVILVKASRGMKFEEVTSKLKELK